MAEQSTADEMRERFKKRIPAEAWEHAKAAQEEMRKSWEAMFPPGFALAALLLTLPFGLWLIVSILRR